MTVHMEGDPVLVATRRALHGVAELVLAGPQYAACGTIKIRVVEGGIGTTRAPDLRIVGSAHPLVSPAARPTGPQHAPPGDSHPTPQFATARDFFPDHRPRSIKLKRSAAFVGRWRRERGR